MDFSVIVAAVLIFVGVLLPGIYLGGGDLPIFVSPSSAFVTFGGTLVSMMLAYSWRMWRDLITLTRVSLFPPRQNVRELIPTLVSFAEKARREGLLALEDNIEELDDEFLKKGVQLVVDGTEPEMVKAIMQTELDALAARHEHGQDLWKTMSSVAPSWGMIGTLLGLIIMLKNLENPQAIGEGMALALITTLYGAVLAYGFATPIAKRLEIYSEKELLLREVMVQGMLSLQSGDNPRILEEKLLAFLAPRERAREKEEKE